MKTKHFVKLCATVHSMVKVKVKIVESESEKITLLKLTFCKVVCDCPFNITNGSLGSRKKMVKVKVKIVERDIEDRRK